MANDHEREEWERLIAFLNTWASAVARPDGRIGVTLTGTDGSQRDVLLHLDPDDWSDMSGTMWGSFDDAAREVQQALVNMPPDHAHLIYGLYQLHSSPVDVLPEDADDAKMREYLRKHPAGGGNWFAVDRRGNHVPFPDGPPRT